MLILSAFVRVLILLELKICLSSKTNQKLFGNLYAFLYSGELYKSFLCFDKATIIATYISLTIETPCSSNNAPKMLESFFFFFNEACSRACYANFVSCYISQRFLSAIFGSNFFLICCLPSWSVMYSLVVFPEKSMQGYFNCNPWY